MRGVLLRMRAGRSGDDSGSMLTELIVTLVIFAVLSTGLLGLALTATKTVSTGKDREVAVQLAAKDLEVVRSNKITDLVQGRTTTTYKQGGQTYTIDHDAQFITLAATGSACGSSGAPAYIRITASVSWENMGNAKPVTASTIVTPAVGTYDKTDGNFGVKVLDRDGQPQPGVNVAMKAGSTSHGSQNTAGDGCAFFAFKDPGSYTATLSAVGFVDPTGATNPAVTQSVATGATANTQFSYDEAATLNFDVNTTSAYPAPSTMPFTVYNTAFLNTFKTRSQTVASGNPGLYYPGGAVTLANKTMTGLYPSLSGYVVWAGSCKDADPGSTYRQPSVAVDPGETVTAPVTNLVKYTATITGLNTTKPWTLTARHANDTAPAACASGETYNLISSGNPSATSMNFSGSLPFGTWTFTVTNNSKTKTFTDTWPGGTTAAENFTLAIT